MQFKKKSKLPHPPGRSNVPSTTEYKNCNVKDEQAKGY